MYVRNYTKERNVNKDEPKKENKRRMVEKTGREQFLQCDVAELRDIYISKKKDFLNILSGWGWTFEIFPTFLGFLE